MGLTARERQVKCRAKLRENEDQYKLYLAKERKRKSLQKAIVWQNMSVKSRKEHLLKEKMRVRSYRQKQKLKSLDKDTMLLTSPYRSNQAMGKAVRRTKLSLPTSPRKKLCVVKAIAKEVGLNVMKQSSDRTGTGNCKTLREDTVKLVREFYLSNDISWQAPGRRDRIIIRETDRNGKQVKRTVQIRYMLMSLTEAYKIFNSMHPSKIGSSKFCELRPQNIKLFEHIPHSVCVCSYHENIRLLLVALKNHTMLSDEFHHFIGQVTCDPSSKECMTRTCEDCANLLDTFAPSEEETPIKYQQWLSGEKVEKANLIASVQDVFSELKKQLKDFLLHTFVKRNQATHMENLISGCDGENVVLPSRLLRECEHYGTK